MSTGYFARATENGKRQAISGVHIVEDGKPICGYEPVDGMQYLWCSPHVQIDYVTCATCKKKHAKRTAPTPVKTRPARRYGSNKRPLGTCMCGVKMEELSADHHWCNQCGRLRTNTYGTGKRWRFTKPTKGTK